MTMTNPIQRSGAIEAAAEIEALNDAIEDLRTELNSWTTGHNSLSIDEYAVQRVRYLEMSQRLTDAIADLDHRPDDAA
ncbi:hypothetical protein BH10ACT3_BH10ACT3_06550 [soil metagenome]